MLQSNQPIYQRAKSSQRQPTPPTISPKALDRKKLQHDDEWLHEHIGRNVSVVFTDGEHLEGTVSGIRKFTFVLERKPEGSVLVHKLAVKYVAELLPEGK
jgi:sRNA-binding regulator protein Hfq